MFAPFVLVGVHVPNKVGRHGHEAASGLTQAAGQEQQPPERLGVVDVIVVVVPLLADILRPDESARVVPSNGACIFFGEVESARHAAQNRAECLFAQRVDSGGRARRVESPLDAIQFAQQVAAIV